MRAWREGFWIILSLHWLSCDGLDLLLELRCHLIYVLRSDQDASLCIGRLLQASLRALCNRGREDVDHTRREHRNVLAYSDQHSRSSQVVTHLSDAFGQLE